MLAISRVFPWKITCLTLRPLSYPEDFSHNFKALSEKLLKQYNVSHNSAVKYLIISGFLNMIVLFLQVQHYVLGNQYQELPLFS